MEEDNQHKTIARLLIMEAEKADEGEYYITAINNYDNITATITLNVSANANDNTRGGHHHLNWGLSILGTILTLVLL